MKNNPTETLNSHNAIFSISNKSQLPVIDGIDNNIIELWKAMTNLHCVNSFHFFNNFY